MQHLDEGFLHALADGEVPSGELGPVREHLESCESCRARLDEARMEAETARELIELIEVPAFIPAERRSGVAAEELADGPTGRRADGRWVRGLALAASLVLAAGIGYYGRGSAPFAVAPAAEPMSVGRIDTVFLDVPAEVAQTRENESNRNAGLDQATNRVQPRTPAPAQAAPPARADEGGARREKDEPSKQKVDEPVRLQETVTKAAAAAPSAKLRDSSEKKEADDKLSQAYRQRAASDSRDQAASNLARKAAEAPAPPAAALEERLMAKTAADPAAVVVTFPRAVELLGGRIKLIEGMVPARLEAVGKVVRVIYRVDEGDVVLAQVSGVDSVLWSLSGPLSADSLGRLRLKVR